jgi:hypothetical protein
MHRSEFDLLNRVDLCFVVDTTGSMSPFLEAARRHLLDAIETLRADARLDLAVGLVEYRDHPPQDSTFVTRVRALESELDRVRRVVANLQPQGGGDAPEAVFDGVHDACIKVAWRAYSRRFALLVGDAPPHGVRAHDGVGSPCRCGLTQHAVTAAAEQQGVTVHALPLTAGATRDAFLALAEGTGGECADVQRPERVIATMAGVLARDFSALSFDREVLTVARAHAEPETARIAESLGVARGPVAASLARLGKRGLLDEKIA